MRQRAPEDILREIARQPDRRTGSKAQLANNLVAITENLANADRVVARRNVVGEEVLFYLLMHWDSREMP